MLDRDARVAIDRVGGAVGWLLVFIALGVVLLYMNGGIPRSWIAP